MTDTATMEQTLDLPPITQTEREQITTLLDTFLSTGQDRNIVPIREVQDLALDLRLILNPVVRYDSEGG